MSNTAPAPSGPAMKPKAGAHRSRRAPGETRGVGFVWSKRTCAARLTGSGRFLPDRFQADNQVSWHWRNRSAVAASSQIGVLKQGPWTNVLPRIGLKKLAPSDDFEWRCSTAN